MAVPLDIADSETAMHLGKRHELHSGSTAVAQHDSDAIDKPLDILSSQGVGTRAGNDLDAVEHHGQRDKACA